MNQPVLSAKLTSGILKAKTLIIHMLAFFGRLHVTEGLAAKNLGKWYNLFFGWFWCRRALSAHERPSKHLRLVSLTECISCFMSGFELCPCSIDPRFCPSTLTRNPTMMRCNGWHNLTPLKVFMAHKWYWPIFFANETFRLQLWFTSCVVKYSHFSSTELNNLEGIFLDEKDFSQFYTRTFFLFVLLMFFVAPLCFLSLSSHLTSASIYLMYSGWHAPCLGNPVADLKKALSKFNPTKAEVQKSEDQNIHLHPWKRTTLGTPKTCFVICCCFFFYGGLRQTIDILVFFSMSSEEFFRCFFSISNSWNAWNCGRRASASRVVSRTLLCLPGYVGFGYAGQSHDMVMKLCRNEVENKYVPLRSRHIQLTTHSVEKGCGWFYRVRSWHVPPPNNTRTSIFSLGSLSKNM